MGFFRLTDILKKVQSQYPVLSKRIKEAEALSRWETAVGPQIAKHARAVRVQDGCLWIEVDHPIWRSELHHRKRQILDKLNLVSAPETPEAPAALNRASPKPGPKPGARPANEMAIEDLVFLNPKSESRR